MTDVVAAPTTGRRLAINGGLWSAASQLIPAVGTAALSVAAGRYLGSGPLGRQSLIAYVNAATSALLIYSLNTALLQLGGRLQGQGDSRRLAQLTRWAIRAQLASGVGVLVVMGASALLVGQDHVAWAIIGVVSVADAAADGMAVRLILTEGWAPIGRLRLVFQLIGPPLGLVFLFLGFGIPGIFFGDGLGALGLLVAVLVRYRQLGTREPRVDSDGLHAGRSIPSVASGRHSRPNGRGRPPVPVARTYLLFAASAAITQVVAKRVEFLVLAIYSTDVAIGMYSVAFMAVNLISMVPTGIAAAAMPMVAAAEGQGRLDRATHHLRFALRMGTAVSIPLVALVAVLGPPAVYLVYGSAYGPAARLIPLAALGLLVAVIAGVCGQYWSGQGRLGIVLGTGIAAGILDLAVAFALVPRFGAGGAVAANLTGQLALGGGLLWVTSRRTGPVGWRIGGVVRMGISGVAGALAALAVQELSRTLIDGLELRSAVSVVVGGVVGVSAVLVVARTLTVFDEDEAGWLRPLLPRRLHGLLGTMTSRHPTASAEA